MKILRDRGEPNRCDTLTVVILIPQFYSIYMEIMTGNIPDTVVILRDQAEEFPLCQRLYI